MATIRLQSKGLHAVVCLLLAGATGCLGLRHRHDADYGPNCGNSSCANPGCATCGHGHGLGVGAHRMGAHAGALMDQAAGPYGPCPTELDRISHPPYKVAPPDILFIDLIRMVPRPPYRIEPLEILMITVSDTLPNQPITGPFVVSPEGTINLGYGYGTVYVAGMTIDQIQNAIRTHLGRTLRSPQVTVALAQFRGFQQVRGEHLVRADGTISLGSYGSVYVAGLSLGQAKCVIEKHLSEYFANPQISIDVFAYNSRVYYVIVDGAGFGQQVFRLPITGNETVLDAIGAVQGLAPVSSKHRITLARPSPVHMGCNQILPVDWRAITEGGSTATNYQIFPGDRIFVGPDRLILVDSWVSKILAPFERVVGFGLLLDAFGDDNNNNNN
jgi:polysaccharide export outer membrane protein